MATTDSRRARALASLVSQSLWLALFAAGCASDPAVCGPGEPPPIGLTATIQGETVTYGGFSSSPNNDCTPPGREPTSISIHGSQTLPEPSMPLSIAFCLPRPDQIGAASIAVETGEQFQIIDVFAQLSDGCLLLFDRTAPVSGTATFDGYCDDGLEPSGYGLSLTATIPVTRMCDGQPDTLELSGRAAVEALSF